MQGKRIIVAIVLAALTPTAAIAGETIKRQVCTKADQQQPPQRQQSQQQRVKAQECRNQRIIPPIVDPTPIFLL